MCDHNCCPWKCSRCGIVFQIDPSSIICDWSCVVACPRCRNVEQTDKKTLTALGRLAGAVQNASMKHLKKTQEKAAEVGHHA